MSNYAAIVADMKSKMEAIDSVGIVHGYSRFATSPEKFLELFVYRLMGGAQQVRGWEISRAAAPEHKRGAYFRHHRMVIDGYMSLKDEDASDATFQELVEEVCDTFREADPPEGASWHYMDGDAPGNSPVQVPAIDIRIFGRVLCHHATIEVIVTERILPGEE